MPAEEREERAEMAELAKPGRPRGFHPHQVLFQNAQGQFLSAYRCILGPRKVSAAPAVGSHPALCPPSLNILLAPGALLTSPLHFCWLQHLP